MYLSREHFANGLCVCIVDQDEQQEYAGRFCDYLNGSRVAIRTLLHAALFSFDHVPNPDVVVWDLHESDEASRGAIFAELMAKLCAYQLSGCRRRMALVVDEAVTVTEHELGGRLRLVRGLGTAAELFRSVEWLELELADLGVEVCTSAEAGEPEIAAADVVVLATGSVPAPDRLGGVDGSIPVLTIDDAVARERFEGSVLFVDMRGDLESALCAEHVALSGGAVTLVTPFMSVGPYLGFTHVNDVLQRLYGLGCTLEPSMIFGGTVDGEAVTRHVHSHEVRQRRFDTVVAGVAGRSDTALAAAVERAGKRLLLAGDAVAPRTALHAFREGDDAGRAA